MSHRTGIVEALATKMASDITGSAAYGGSPTGVQGYTTNLEGSVSTVVKFQDDINEFPHITVSPGPERREYHPANFSWGFLTVMVRVFAQGDTADTQLENIISDIERFIDLNFRLAYTVDSIDGGGNIVSSNFNTEDILIDSIVTDEGLLRPDAVGEVVLQVRYDKPRA